MYEILKREEFNFKTTRIEIAAPFVARHAEPGQFIILRVTEDGERIPLTISDFDRERGTVTVIFQTIGATTGKYPINPVPNSNTHTIVKLAVIETNCVLPP